MPLVEFFEGWLELVVAFDGDERPCGAVGQWLLRDCGCIRLWRGRDGWGFFDALEFELFDFDAGDAYGSLRFDGLVPLDAEAF